MFGTPENNNTELHSDTTSGDVSEVESGLEVTESEMDGQLPTCRGKWACNAPVVRASCDSYL